MSPEKNEIEEYHIDVIITPAEYIGNAQYFDNATIFEAFDINAESLPEAAAGPGKWSGWPQLCKILDRIVKQLLVLAERKIVVHPGIVAIIKMPVNIAVQTPHAYLEQKSQWQFGYR